MRGEFLPFFGLALAQKPNHQVAVHRQRAVIVGLGIAAQVTFAADQLINEMVLQDLFAVGAVGCVRGHEFSTLLNQSTLASPSLSVTSSTVRL